CRLSPSACPFTDQQLEVGMSEILFAVGRFLSFFFVLVLTIALLITVYSALATAPASQTWDAVKALVVTALVLLLLALGSGLLAQGVAQQGRTE
ncbi:MAG TPA: hypothetical protein VF221_22240, partial [Chloroflexota bacterium]